MQRFEEKETSTQEATIQRDDRYRYCSETEISNAAFTDLARRVHAESYLGEGFIHRDAIEQNGHVTGDIDKATGEHVEYYLGFAKDRETESQPVVTLRKISVSERGLASLPGYQLCGQSLYPEGNAALQTALGSGRTIKEISSFGHIPTASPLAGFELLRHALQESRPRSELWFFTMVTEKYNTLVKQFGPKAVQKIGDEVAINDDRVGNVLLTPALVDTTTFFDDVAGTIFNESDIYKRRRYASSLRFFTNGIDPSTLNVGVQRYLTNTAFDPIAYARTRAQPEPVLSWSQPELFRLTHPADAFRIAQLVDAHEIRRVIEPDWQRESKIEELNDTLVYYPWNGSLVRFPSDEQAYFDAIHKRDNNLVTSDEQANRIGKAALYGGLSVGSHIAEHMSYAGVVQHHVLADYDTISASNLNRIHASVADIGEPKIDTIAKKISELNPYSELTLLREGITTEALDAIPVPSIIFDAVDDFAAKALLRTYAKQHRVPLVMASDVGYNSIIDIERHDLSETKPFNGRVSEKQFRAMLHDDLSPEVKRKILTRIIGLSNASVRLLESVIDPALEGFPQLEVTASQGGALATIAARDILLGRPVPSGRRVHKARRSLGLHPETSVSEGLQALRKFIAKQ